MNHTYKSAKSSTKSKVVPISKQFIPASHNLASGMLKEAMMDTRRILRKAGEALLDFWLEMVYSTSLFLQELKDVRNH